MNHPETFRFLGMPPSSNHGYKATSKGGKTRVYKAEDVKVWQESVAWQVKAKMLGQDWTGRRLRLMWTVADPKEKIDLSNAIKYTEDALSRTLGFNDKKVSYMSVMRLYEDGPESIEVHVSEE